MSGPIVVTGAAGFVGRHLVHALARESAVVGWHRADPAPAAVPGVTWMRVDQLDGEAVADAIGALQPASIYHCAGVANVGDSWALAEHTLASNVLGTTHLFDALRQHNRPARVVVTGSATIYRPSDAPLTEDAPIAPNTPYGTSKLAQEMVSLRAFGDDGIPAIVTRSFNHIGPGQSPAFAAASFARQLARIEAGLEPPALAVGNLAPRRDVSDVRDTVRAYIALMAHGRPGTCYNVCSGRAVSVQQILDGLRQRVPVEVSVRTDPARLRPTDTPVIVGSHARLTADTGWTPQHSLDDTLDALIAYWRNEVRGEPGAPSGPA